MKQLANNNKGMVPLVAIFWILMITCAALSWIWLSAALLFAMGITAWGIVKIGRKKYITGLITIMMGVAGFILVYLLITGGLTL